MKGMRLLGIPDEWPAGSGGEVQDPRRPHPPASDGDRELQATPTRRSDRFALFVRKAPVLDDPAGSGRDGSGRGDHGAPGTSETPPEWWTRGTATRSRRDEVRQFKAKAWRIGQQIKDEQSWCGTYEHVDCSGRGHGAVDPGGYRWWLRRSATGWASGMRLDSRSAPCSCTGRSDWTDHWAVYVRDDTPTTCAGLVRRRVTAAENAPALGNYQSSMLVLSTPVGGSTAYVVEQQAAPRCWNSCRLAPSSPTPMSST